jgi:hypothetical protein
LYFTDQKWINLAPAYFECTILKDPGLNLAPWNLDERPLKFQENILYTKDVRLRLIHFSQMSSILAAGGKSSLWETMIKDKEDSTLRIIEGITKDYSENLIQIQHTLGSKKMKMTSGRNGTLYKVLKLANKGRVYKSNLLARFIGSLVDLTKPINAFDRSATYSSLVRNIPKDLIKIRKRLWGPKKRKPSLDIE